MEFHEEQLKKHCRVCGKRLNKAKGKVQPVYSCTENSVDLATLVGIDNCKEKDEQVFPQFFCNPCRSKMTRAKKSKEDGFPFYPIISKEWSPHQEQDCEVCLHFTKVSKGGGCNAKEVSRRGRLSGETPRSVIQYIRSIVAAPLPEDPTPKFVPNSLTEKLACSICHGTVNRPVQISCGSTVCSECCCRAIQNTYNLNCPCCAKHLLSSATIAPPSPLLESLLNDRLLFCVRCEKVVKLEEYNTHLASNCRSHHVIMNSPSKVTLRDVLSKPTTAPATPVELRTAHHLVRRIIQQDEGASTSGVISVPTCGQPITLVQVPRCRVSTASASRRTVGRRSDFLGTVRHIASGGDSNEQFAAELKTLSKLEREDIIQSAQLPVVIPVDHSLAIKADLGIPWTKIRVIRRWFKTFNVSMASERQQRTLAKEIVTGDNLVAERGAFTFALEGGRDEIREVPFVYRPNFIGAVADLVNKHEKADSGLTWHKGAIPSDEIWVKVGGDKGHGSFKLNLQLMNTSTPNSVKRTTLLSVFKAGDSTTNLHTALNMYREHVVEAQGMHIKNRKLRLFHSGDYEYLCRMYGLSGASGRHNCLWCLIPSSMLVKPPSQRQPYPGRSLASLKADHSSFLTAGHGRLKLAKHYNNIIGEVIFEIPIDHVCIPGLHMSLGIFNRLWTLLEESCKKEDFKLAMDNSSDAMFQQLLALKTESETQQSYLSLISDMQTYSTLSGVSDQDVLDSLKAEHSATQLRIQDMATQISCEEARIKRSFDYKKAPFFSSLEDSLQELNVKRQAYQGGTFVGNHVHKLLKSKNIEVLTGNIRRAASKHGRSAEAVAVADQLAVKFREAFSLFGSCHTGYNSSHLLTDDDLKKIETDIRTFMDFYRRSFPLATVLPKMHIMEEHVMPWLRKWRLGAGLMGEQGAESIHAQFMKLERTHHGIPNEVDRLKYIMKEHLLASDPSLTDLRPPIKKRKKLVEGTDTTTTSINTSP